MNARKRTPKCPVCKDETRAADNTYFPFCGKRCQMVDLGRWLGEEYRMPAPLTERDIGQLEQIMTRQDED